MSTSTKVRTRKFSWLALVNKADPKRKRRKVEYIFSNGRKFKEK